MTATDGEALLARDLATLVTLDEIAPARFASRYSITDYQGGHLFGGQLIAQALTAAGRTLGEDRTLHSAHTYYLRVGDVKRPVEFAVDSLRDGRSFSTRQVSAMQDGKLLLQMTCSANTRELGALNAQAAMPAEAGRPQDHADIRELVKPYAGSDLAEAIDRLLPMDFADVRPIDPERVFRPGSGGDIRVWLRIPSLAGETSPAMQAAMLGFLSDYFIAYAPWRLQERPFTFAGPGVSSLDHSLWLHRPVACGDWLLYDMACPTGAGAVGFATGRIYDSGGALVASSAQEVLYRG